VKVRWGHTGGQPAQQRQQVHVHRDRPVAVGRQLLRPALTRLVSRVLAETQLPPACLDLEISEADLLANSDRCIERLRELKALGVTLSIDDYGAGQSGLSQLHRYPVDSLKIDRTVIGSITTDRNQEAVASAAIALARTRKLRVVAEGVETDEQRLLLDLWQCDRICCPGFTAYQSGQDFLAKRLDWGAVSFVSSLKTESRFGFVWQAKQRSPPPGILDRPTLSGESGPAGVEAAQYRT